MPKAAARAGVKNLPNPPWYQVVEATLRPRPSLFAQLPSPLESEDKMSNHNNLSHMHSKDSRFLVDPKTPNDLLSSQSAYVVDLPQRPLHAYLHGYPPTRSMNTAANNSLQDVGAVGNFPASQFSSVSNTVRIIPSHTVPPLF